MTTKVGRIAQLGISTDGGTTYDYLTRLVDCSYELTSDEIDMTSHDSQSYREFEYGLISGQITANFIYDENEAEQEELFSSFFAQTRRYFQFVTEDGTGNSQMTALCMITGLNHGAPLEGMQTIDLTLRIAGPVTRSDQP